MKKKQIKIGIICSSGGHFFKAIHLQKWWKGHTRFWVTRSDALTNYYLKDEIKYWGYFPENRNFFNLFRNLILAYFILQKERPHVIFSTGAGIAPPFFFIAKLLKIKTIFIETFILVPRPTLSGRMVYYISDLFIVQNKELLSYYPKAQYYGSIL